MDKFDHELVEVFCGAETVAHIVEGRLESKGIPLILKPVGEAYLSVTTGSRRLSVLVPRKYATAAKRLIEPGA